MFASMRGARGRFFWGGNHSQHMGQGVGQGAGEEERRRGGEEERRRGRHFKAKSVFIHIHGLRVLQKYEESGKKIMVSGDALRDPAPLACVRDEWQRVRGESRRVCAVLHECSVHLKIAGLVLGMIACWLCSATNAILWHAGSIQLHMALYRWKRWMILNE